MIVEKQIKAPEEKKPELDWDAPTEMYYTMGMSPLDPTALISRYRVDEKAQANTVWLRTDKTTIGFLSDKDSNGTLYRHENIQDAPEVASDDQLEAITDVLAIEKAMKKNCKKLTERMSFDLVPEDYSEQIILLKMSNEAKIQTWFFVHKEEGYHLISQRDINKPKGYISRCKEAFDKDVITPVLKSATYNF